MFFVAWFSYVKFSLEVLDWIKFIFFAMLTNLKCFVTRKTQSLNQLRHISRTKLFIFIENKISFIFFIKNFTFLKHMKQSIDFEFKKSIFVPQSPRIDPCLYLEANLWLLRLFPLVFRPIWLSCFCGLCPRSSPKRKRPFRRRTKRYYLACEVVFVVRGRSDVFAGP